MRKLVWTNWNEDVKVIWKKYKNQICILSHVVAGLISALAILISPVLTVVGFLVFTLYEMNQDFHKDDYFDEELMEYGIGFFLGIVVLLIWWYLFGV